MNWNPHYELVDRHAEFPPSSYHWLNYDDDKVIDFHRNIHAKELGTELHALAAQCIKHGLKVAKKKNTINMFINDAIGYHMDPEVTLKFNNYFYGTTDGIAFKKKILRISDLKTGVTPAHMEQLAIYAALFFLEYGDMLQIKPKDVETELRIYQFDDIRLDIPEPDYIEYVMERMKHISQIIHAVDTEEASWIIT